MQQQHTNLRQALRDFSFAALLALAVGTSAGAVGIGFVWLLAFLNG